MPVLLLESALQPLAVLLLPVRRVERASRVLARRPSFADFRPGAPSGTPPTGISPGETGAPRHLKSRQIADSAVSPIDEPPIAN